MADDLRTRRHEATRSALFDAAISLFAEHGYSAVTVEQIAAAAGVSRRTAYRRFRNKDDIVLELPRRWLGIWDSIAAATESTSTRERVEQASLAVSAHVDEHRAETLVALSVLDEAPALAARSVAGDDWHRRITTLLVGDGVGAVDADVIAGAYLGGIDAMLVRWASDPDETPLVELNVRLNERLRSIWPS